MSQQQQVPNTQFKNHTLLHVNEVFFGDSLSHDQMTVKDGNNKFDLLLEEAKREVTELRATNIKLACSLKVAVDANC